VREDVVLREREELAAAHAVCELDLREDDERKDERRRHARAEERVETVQAERRRRAERDPAVEPHERRRADERAEADREGDLSRRGALARREAPQDHEPTPEPSEHSGMQHRNDFGPSLALR